MADPASATTRWLRSYLFPQFVARPSFICSHSIESGAMYCIGGIFMLVTNSIQPHGFSLAYAVALGYSSQAVNIIPTLSLVLSTARRKPTNIELVHGESLEPSQVLDVKTKEEQV
ncbi:hypothetical protein B0H11DRAFT_631111 [Mycena galericulata]|nr:hypothetical protein B0H11DRAFT_631111 [Mycena galericulata]